MNLITLLSYIEKKPLMYLNERSLRSLENFIAGFYLCESLNNINDSEGELFRDKFYPWLLTQFNYLTSTNTWLGLIEQVAQFENQDEFDCFFHYLEKFNQSMRSSKHRLGC